MTDSIGNALGLSEIEKMKAEIAVPKSETDADFDYARQNIYDIIETGANALNELAQFAAQSQHPRAYEVVATLVKTLVDANKSLIDLKKTKMDMQKDAPDNNSTNFRNNVFIGSTAELQKMLKHIAEPPKVINNDDEKVIDIE